MSSESFRGYSSRDYFTLELIPFVTSTQEQEAIPETKVKSEPIVRNISGKEASKFYNDILAIPSTSKPNPSTSVPNVSKMKPPSNKSNKYRSDNFHRYCQDGDLEAVKACVSVKDKSLINVRDQFGWTPLMCATCEGHFDIAKYLIQCGADVTLQCNQGKTAVTIAHEKHHFEIVNLLMLGFKSENKECITIKEEKEKYCDDCNIFHHDSVIRHERSIAHLLATKKANHTTFYHIPEDNKGFQLLVKSGWDQNKGLGAKGEGRKFPIKTILKKDRSCIGKHKEIARVTHFNANDCAAVRRICDPISLRIVRERTLKRKEREKLERKNRQKEIEFRRQFLDDDY